MRTLVHASPIARVCAILLLWIVSATFGCSKKHERAPGSEARIVSLSPSTTEALFAIGAGPSLVGRSRYCDYPPEVKKLPEVGGYVDPSLEAILGLRPDLVIGARGPAGRAITEKLEARGIATFFPETESFAAIDAMILGLGERTGRTSAARAEIESLRTRLAKIDAVVAELPKARVLIVFGLSPISVAGPQSFAAEMLGRAGGINAVTQGGAYPTIGVEQVIALDPDIIINAAMMEERASERLRKDAAEWVHVRAIQQDHVTSITDESVLRPGPRIARGVALLARAIHPGAAIDVP